MSIATERPHPDNPNELGSATPLWHKSAPKEVRQLYHGKQSSKGWKAWQKHLEDRKTPCRPAKLFAKDTTPLAWGLNGELSPAFADLQNLQQALDGDVEQTLQNWLDDSAAGTWGAEYALSCLAWCWALPKLAAVLPAEAWWSLLNHLIRTATEAVSSNIEDRSVTEDPWVRQVLAGELPLTLAYLFPELALCRALHPAARATLSAGLLDLLDGEGLLHARLFGQLRSLLACWTRCIAMGRRMKRRCWNEDAHTQYRWLTHNALCLTRRNGASVFSTSDQNANDWKLLRAALHFGGDKADWTFAAVALPGKQLFSKRADVADSKEGRRVARSKGDLHSEWAAAAVLRPNYSPTSPRLTVLFPDADCRTEFACGKDVLWSGLWDFEVRVDGRTTQPAGEWQETCWVSDDDVDYLELQIDLTEGLRIQRHFLLAREDRILMLADAVLGPRYGALQYRGTLPLAGGIQFQQAQETREAALLAGKCRAIVAPLALSEWKATEEAGEMTQTPDGLELRQVASGSCLFAPLFFDLAHDRMLQPLTWRQLTVAESLNVVPTDVAVGYRITVADRHWLIYRALSSVSNRTLLGHNLSTEMLVARFGSDGEVEPLLAIEP